MSQGQKDAQRSASPPTGLAGAMQGVPSVGVPALADKCLAFTPSDFGSAQLTDFLSAKSTKNWAPERAQAFTSPSAKPTGDRRSADLPPRGAGGRRADGTPTLQGSNHFRGRYISESASPLKISGHFSTPFLPTYADFGVNKGEGDFSVYFLANKAVFRRAQ